MYFVSATGEEKWQSDVRSTISSDTYTKYVEGLYDSIEKDVKDNSTLINYFSKRTQSVISSSKS